MLAFLSVLLLCITQAFAAVNLNTATAADLEALPGIGPSKAAAILQYRAEHGPFKSVAQLDDVSGIGPSTLANLQGLVTVGDTPPGAAPPPGAPPPASRTAGPGCPVNINTADASALERLPGIGAARAADIVKYRADKGPFSSCDQLDAVSGIGPATLAGLRDCCVVK